MTEPIDLLKQTLKQHNQSLTAARQIVFDALLDKEPQTMHEVVFNCEGLVNRTSVYRVISLYEQLGIVKRLPIGWKYKLELSDMFHSHHHHLTCVRCGLSIKLEADDHLEQHLTDAATQHGFTISDHQLEIQGLCSHCKAIPKVA